MDTIYARLDTAATIYFITQFCVASIGSSYYSRAVFIKLGREDEEIHWLQMPGRQSEETLPSTATDTELEESDPFADELEENKLVLEDC